MSEGKEIGGYFGLELPSVKSTLHGGGILLNSGRHALEYIIKNYPSPVSKVHLPYYTCDVVLEPLDRLGITYKFYPITEALELRDDIILNDNEIVILNNYFGIKDSYIRSIIPQFGSKAIVDCAQAFFMPSTHESSYFYSPRKFFGMPDGGIAVTPFSSSNDELEIDESYNRCSHLLKRIDTGASSGYKDFHENSKILKTESLKAMSQLSQRILSSIDFEKIKEIRKANFSTLHKQLGEKNLLKIPDIESFEAPMVYPFRTKDNALRQKLIANKVFVARYWPNVTQMYNTHEIEAKLADEIIPLPIDQRYSEKDMYHILNIINS